MKATRRSESNDMGHTDLCAFNLAVASFATEVMTHFPDVGDACRCNGVSLGLQPTGDIDGKATIAPRGAGVEKVDCTAFFAQHQVVVVNKFGCGEAVM